MSQESEKKSTEKLERSYQISPKGRIQALKELVIYYKAQKRLHHPHPPEMSVDEKKFQEQLKKWEEQNNPT